MKKFLKTTTVLALFLTTAISMAKNSDVRLSAEKEGKSLVLTLEGASNDLKLTFTDSNENILYFEKLTDGTKAKTFNLKGLEDGTYYLTTTDTQKVIVYTVSVNGENVTISGKDELIKPSFRKTKEKLFVNFLNLDSSKVDIKVYDEENRLVFTETLLDKMVIEKAFNFKGAFAGAYSVIVTDSKKSFLENFIVD